MKRGRPRSLRKAPDAASAFVRYSAEEYKLIRSAMDLQSVGVIGGYSITVSGFTRAAALGMAQKIVEVAAK